MSEAAAGPVSRLEGSVLAFSDRAWATWFSLPLLYQDACLYGLAAVFALGTLVMAVSADYREWAEIAIWPYLGAALASVAMQRRLGRHDAKGGAGGPKSEPSRGDGSLRARRRARSSLILVLFLTTVALPLSLELVWRAGATSATTGSQAQPEVAVIERAGDRLAHGKDPYPTSPSTPGVSPATDRASVDANSFFPYLPGMAVFGLGNAALASKALGDARVVIVLTTVLIAGAALLVAGGDPERRRRVAQILVVLPTGALPLVTGGDDLPVLALMLLGLVLAAKRRPVAAGLALGVACTMKFTAFGLVLLLAFGVFDRRGRRAWGPYLVAAGAVALPVVAAGILANPHAFVVNVVEFPLGLTKVNSPAASPLLGQELVVLLPALKKELTAALFGIAAVLIIWALLRHAPRGPAAVARFTALAIIVVVIVAPATRFGYFMYPVNLLVWGRFLRTVGPEAEAQLTSPCCSSRICTTQLADDWSPPASAGATVGE